MSEDRPLHVNDFDPELKALLIAESRARGLSINDCAIGALAAHYGVRYVGTGRRSPGATVSDGSLLLPLPDVLYRKIAAQVDRQPKGRRSKKAVVEDVLRGHFAALVAASAATSPPTAQP
jgi:hypothetical protein